MVIRMSEQHLYQRDGPPSLIAVGQICSTNSMTHNLALCRKVLTKAVPEGVKAVFFPEASDYIGINSEESLSLCLPAEKSPFVLGLQEDAKKHSISICVGIHEPSDDPNSKRIKNTVVWINERGHISHRYQKLHMFDIQLEGKPPIQESEFVEPGSEIVEPFESVVGRVGLAICFDIRFPEISLALKRMGADVIIFPSAFTVPTGRAHWMSLVRTRAIECQTYVIAAAQVGPHNEKRRSYGHSMIVSPWGEVIGELGDEANEDGAEVLYAKIDLSRVEEARKQIPLLRRTDVYPEV